ncbi:alpha/beta hydrolase [Weissella muntiaci]|uniref:Alpha/beta hydrolase n=2 Tax=Weissella muntiaci TaxID=2508881 RepID=A0A6C2CB99_9LACO|nr:alpha/beta hydrolase [Weissella muntiaci]
MHFKTVDIDGVELFYREAGDVDKPTMLLLHGFPSASHMFRDLIPLLMKDYHVIAPDFPGFGQTVTPDNFTFTFENLTKYTENFLKRLKLDSFYMYVFDYGAPIGFRIASRHPDWIKGIVSQNGNAYQAGLGPKWAERAEFWHNPTEEKRVQYRNAFSPEVIINQYLQGSQKEHVSPDGYTLDIAYTSKKAYADHQLDLIFDYQDNVANYPVFQKYFRQYQPKLLAIWGENDQSFIPAGAEAFLDDLPNAKVVLIDAGHFALETHAEVVAAQIIQMFEY